MNGLSDWQKCCLAYQGGPKSCATPCNHCARMAKVLVEERKFVEATRPSSIINPDIAHLSAENAHLRERLQYAYTRINYGFVYGDFDLSVLRQEAKDWLADNGAQI